jgi:hypothetical protein
MYLPFKPNTINNPNSGSAGYSKLCEEIDTKYPEFIITSSVFYQLSQFMFEYLYYKYRSTRLNVRTFLGQSAFLYGAFQKSLGTPRSKKLVVPNTQVCIEAPSGSGNSFFVNGFKMANPGVQAAHHHHVAAQIKRAVAFDVPRVVILRNPIDCVVSRSCREPWRIAPVYLQWIRFFHAVEALRQFVLIASFHTVTTKPETVVGALNAKFGTNFNMTFPKADEVFLKMDRQYARAVGAHSGLVINPNRPHLAKEDLKNTIRPLVMRHRLSHRAFGVYESLSKHAF